VEQGLVTISKAFKPFYLPFQPSGTKDVSWFLRDGTRKEIAVPL